MGTLEQVMQMQQQGYSDADISNQLQQEGIAPSEIANALGQAKVKSAVSGTQNNVQEPLPENPAPEQAPPGAAPIPPPLDQPQPQGQYAQSANQQQYAADQYASDPYAQSQQQQYADQYAQSGDQEYYPQTPQAYSDQGYTQDYYSPSSVSDSETISEIASQVVAEKIENFRRETGDIKGFQDLIQERINRLDERLKKIERSIAHLNQAVIGKIGEFGQNSALIHKDLDNLHTTVSKLMGNKLDEHHKKSRSTPHHKSSHLHMKKKK